jgi:two-component system chemotaxis response regulator CheY
MTGEKKKVLICDDSLLIRTQLKDFIGGLDQNIEIIEAWDGKVAVDIFAEHRPDLVFLDVVMPNENGISCLKRIREIEPQALVVMLSSSGTPQMLKEALTAGACDFVQKPWTEANISQILTKFLD